MGYLIIWCMCAAICAGIANEKSSGNVAMAAILGFLLGPIGVLIVLLGKSDG